MDLLDAIHRRRMTRRFADRNVPAAVLAELIELADHAPSAGGTTGTELLVLQGSQAREVFWEHSSAAQWREQSDQAKGLLAAPVIVLVLASPSAYVERYGAQDKITSPLGGLEASDWPVPYWFVDAGFAGMLLLLGAVEHGLGALFFHVRGERAGLLRSLGIPDEFALVGAVALGYQGERPSTRTPSGHRPRTRVHYESYGAARPGR